MIPTIPLPDACTGAGTPVITTAVNAIRHRLRVPPPSFLPHMLPKKEDPACANG